MGGLIYLTIIVLVIISQSENLAWAFFFVFAAVTIYAESERTIERMKKDDNITTERGEQIARFCVQGFMTALFVLFAVSCSSMMSV